MRNWIVFWLASLAVVAGLTSVLSRAQAPEAHPPYTAQAQPSNVRVISGADIGFRVENVSRTGEPTGTLVVRVNGDWVPVTFTGGLRPAF